MDKETLVSSLKEKVGETNLSDRTFSEIADQFASMFEDDSKITDDSWNLPIAVFRSMSGQLRHELSDGINTFKTDYQKNAEAEYAKKMEDAKKAWEDEWKKNHPEPQKPQDTPPANDDIAKQIADALKNVTGADSELGKSLKAMNEFMARQAEEKKASDVAKVRQQLKDYLINDRKANREPAVNLAISKLEIGENANIDQLKMQAEKGYEAVYKEFFGDGGKPFGGSSAGGGENGGDADIKKYLQEKQAAMEAQRAQAEEVRKNFM